MDTTEKTISNLIEQQFPEIYRIEGQTFVAFLRSYFEWMESEGNPIWYTRRLPEIKDIDETLDQFISHFKNKYLNKIPINSHTDIRMLVKHSLDLYRSKGTERGVDLLFKLVFGENVEIYYPSEDIFRLSDGVYVTPMYLEVTLSDNNKRFVNRQIEGLNSRSTAFVERVVRRTVGIKLIDVFYISAIRGNFQTGEKVRDSLRNVPIGECPSVVGSFTSLDVSASGTGRDFTVGHIVDVDVISINKHGLGGKARVVEVNDIVGIITFQLIDGGYGYSNSAEVLISDSVITTSNIAVNATPVNYFQLFETVTQTQAGINYTDANAHFTIGANVYTYSSNGTQSGYGTILGVTENTANQGILWTLVLSGNMNSNAIFTTGNAIGANVPVSNGYTDRTATANIMAIAANLLMSVSSPIGDLNMEVGETLYQYDFANSAQVTAFGHINKVSGGSGTGLVLDVVTTQGVFLPAKQVHGGSSNAWANLLGFTLELGVLDSTGTLVTGPIHGPVSQTNAYISIISQGADASFQISLDDTIYQETVNLNSDMLRDYFNVQLAANTYGFPGDISANATHGTIGGCLSWATETVGRPFHIDHINPGHDYNRAPMVRIYDKLVAGAGGLDRIVLTVNSHGSVGSFSLGEMVQQGVSNARGIVISSNSNYLLLQRASVLNNFLVSNDDIDTVINGIDSGAIANVSSVDIGGIFSTVLASNVVGLDAVVDANVATAVGAITKLVRIDSGFGYIEGEEVQIIDPTNPVSVGTAFVHLGELGRGSGYYKQKGGFLSDQKKLYDGMYYQEYSYEIRSSLTLDKYKDLMVNVMHFAGSKMFGSLHHYSGAIDNTLDIETTTTITVT